jgi:vancomycin resistance protein YoaR
VVVGLVGNLKSYPSNPQPVAIHVVNERALGITGFLAPSIDKFIGGRRSPLNPVISHAEPPETQTVVQEQKEVVKKPKPCIIKYAKFQTIACVEIDNPMNESGKNAELAARLINGTIVKPGETFSFNRTVGPRLPSRGFGEGQTVVNTVYGPKYEPGIGGGVCRTSTVIHQAVQEAGLEVIERHSHSLSVQYAEPGEDAAVVYGYWDYKFKNTIDQPVKIEVNTEGEKIKVMIKKQVIVSGNPGHWGAVEK